MNLKHIRRKGVLAFALLGASIVAPAAYADSLNLIVNGSFEDPIVAASSQCGAFANCLGFHNGVAGNDNIGGWQLIGKGGVDSGGLAIPGADATVMLLGYDYAEPDDGTGKALYFHPQDGLQSIDLTGEGNQGTTNGIKQSVETTPGLDYELSFWIGHQYSAAPGYTEGPALVALYIDGELVGSLSNALDTREDVSWTLYTHEFTASGSQTVIAFLNDTPYGNNYAGLDDVSLTAVSVPLAPATVPEPSSILLIGAGMICLAVFGRYRTDG